MFGAFVVYAVLLWFVVCLVYVVLWFASWLGSLLFRLPLGVRCVVDVVGFMFWCFAVVIA